MTTIKPEYLKNQTRITEKISNWYPTHSLFLN